MRTKYIIIQTRSHLENAYASVKITAKHNHEIEQRDINKIVKIMCARFAKLIQKTHFQYQVTVECENIKYHKEEHDERTIIPSSNKQIVNLTKIQLNNIDPELGSRSKILTIEFTGLGWNLQKVIYFEVHFHKTNGLRGNNYVKFFMRSNANLINRNIDTFYFIWSVLAKIYPIVVNPQKVTKYRDQFKKISIGEIKVTNGMHITDILKFERLNNNLSINVRELQNNKDEKILLFHYTFPKKILIRQLLIFYYTKLITYCL